MKHMLVGFFDVLYFFVSSSGVAIFLYIVVAQPHQVNGNSMYPNFHNGEFLLTDKLSYKFNNPKRGDVVVFAAPPQAHCPVGINCDFIKRIIALPGEKIKVEQGYIYINGKMLKEPYENLSHATRGGSTNTSFLPEGVEKTVPSGHYVVFGDNRSGSSDSRDWGPVPKKNFVGAVRLRYWPPEVAGALAFESASLE